MKNTTTIDPFLCAKLAGIVYLVMVVAGPFSMMYVPGVVIEAGDASATANNLRAFEGLFRLGQAGYALVLLGDLLLGVLLYMLFRPAGELLSLIALAARLGTAFVHVIILLLNVFVLLLVGEVAAPASIDRNLGDSLALLFLDLHQQSSIAWGLFFGVHCAAIGWLAYVSGFIPKFIGLLMVIAGGAYLINSFGMLTLPSLAWVFMLVVAVGAMGELAFAFWLLFKGVDIQRWHAAHEKEANQGRIAEAQLQSS